MPLGAHQNRKDRLSLIRWGMPHPFANGASGLVRGQNACMHITR